jgi:hypothetical protein
MQQVAWQNSACIRTTRRYIPEGGNIHNYRCGNLESFSKTNYDARFRDTALVDLKISRGVKVV